MKKKYIIALESRNVWSCGLPAKTLLLSDVSIFGTDLASVNTGIELTPYTEPDLEQIRKEAYDKGYHDGHNVCCENAKDLMEEKKNEAYQHGLADAWEAARKATYVSKYGGYGDCLDKVFNRHDGTKWDVFDYSASESIEKIRQYEQEKKEQDGLRQNIQTIVDQCGYTLDEIAAVLEKMRGEQG